MNNTNSKNNKTDLIDVQYFINLILNNWLIIGFCVFVALVLAYGVNKFSPRIYEVNTSIVINEENTGVANASAQLLQEFGFINFSKNFSNEILVLRSSPVVGKALNKLDFQVSYFEKTLFSEKELYKSTPFIVIPDLEHPQAIYCRFNINVLDGDKFMISCDNEKVMVFSFVSNEGIQELPSFQLSTTAKFGTYISNDYLKFKIILNKNYNLDALKEKTFSFQINNQHGLIKMFQAGLRISPPDIESTVATISMRTTVPEKAIDFLNSLTGTYVQSGLDKKKHTSLQTIEYINNQLNIVGDSLRTAEHNLQNFRSRNDVVDITIQSGHVFEEMRDLETQRVALGTNQKYYDYIQKYFNTSQEFDELIAPSAMGINDPMLNNLIEELIRLNAERASFVENKQEKSPYLKKINIRIENLRNMVSENISYYRQTNKIALEDINVRIKQLNSELRKLPKTEQELFGIERKFNINDAIYTYLLEKRSEAEIAKASYQPDTDVIEPASLVGGGPVAPDTKMNYIMAFVLGILFPVGLLRIKDFLTATMSNEEEITKITGLPIIGKIYHNDKNTENVVEEFPKSHIAESFRLLRVNLNFFLGKDESNVILVNSSISGEGKSFISLNLALTLANSGLRVMLLGFDLRKPRDYKPLAINSGLGLTQYLSGQATIMDVIQKTENNNLDIILSGIVPPNPAELMSSAYTDELFEMLKNEYDFIVVDAPPIGIVSDGHLLMEKSNLCVFVSRIKKTPRKIYKSLEDDLVAKNYKMCSLINDIPVKRKTKYGYGYYEDTSKKRS